MISTELARSLRQAGLAWHPASGDFFRIERPEFENDVFTVSDMAIESHEFDTGTILGFNGTTEWALDSLALEDALWLPREDQLRTFLGPRFHSLHRLAEDQFRVVIDIGGVRVDCSSSQSSDAADAYSLAILAVLEGIPHEEESPIS
jgi:hypothetical protein